MQIDIQEKQLHTKERASDFNLDLPNEIASDDPINEEDKSPPQRHEFSFSSQGVSLGKLGSSPPRIVSVKVGGSKRIEATRSYCEDMVVSQSFDNTKRKREHVIEDSCNNPYLFQAPRRRYLDCGHSDFIRSGLFFYFGHRSTSGGACFFDWLQIVLLDAADEMKEVEALIAIGGEGGRTFEVSAVSSSLIWNGRGPYDLIVFVSLGVLFSTPNDIVSDGTLHPYGDLKR
ncbi:hypothetical protein RHSIM_Rhsim08G0185400 [Rhododendron simsii]|uniref:Uncharacterized protein n=1 Tax=Rhododendron simsii TaxID=118357 RepID=A0A834GKM4_RHOSS|nr:hypothetical protein RHSIM_Rhsim08G0185400 [Rhododendron simsii]